MALSPLHVDENKLKDANGKVIKVMSAFHGSNRWWDDGTGYNVEQFAYMKSWGFTAVNIGVANWDIEAGCLNDPNFWTKLDNLISWAEQNGLYVILRGFMQWANTGPSVNAAYVHDITGYFTDGTPNPNGGAMFTWTQFYDIWRTFATRYVGKTNLIFDIFTEPLGGTATNYVSRVRACIDAIRAIDPTRVIAVESWNSDWPSSLNFEQTNPVGRSNIVFAHDFYGNHIGSNTEAAIQQHYDNLGITWCIQNGRCVIHTEFGGRIDDQPFDSYQQTFIINMMTRADALGLSGYSAWVWQPGPGASGLNLLTDWNGTPTTYGNTIKTYYLEHPATDGGVMETYLFDHWTINGETFTEKPLPLTVVANLAVVANYVLKVPPIQYTLTITVTQGGTTDPPPDTYLLDQGTLIQVTALSSPDYKFLNWLVNGVPDTRNPISLTMTADYSLEAVFEYVPPPPVTATISGVTRDSDTSELIAAAVVTCDGYADITEINGSFIFANIPAQQYTLTATKEGYMPKSIVVDASQGGPVTVDLLLKPIIPVTPANIAPYATLLGSVMLLISSGR